MLGRAHFLGHLRTPEEPLVSKYRLNFLRIYFDQQPATQRMDCTCIPQSLVFISIELNMPLKSIQVSPESEQLVLLGKRNKQ